MQGSRLFLVQGCRAFGPPECRSVGTEFCVQGVLGRECWAFHPECREAKGWVLLSAGVQGNGSSCLQGCGVLSSGYSPHECRGAEEHALSMPAGPSSCASDSSQNELLHCDPIPVPPRMPHMETGIAETLVLLAQRD